MEKREKINRHPKRKFRKLFVSIALFFLLSMIGKIHIDTNTFKLNRISLQSSKLDVGTEISLLQITDVHSKVFGENNEELIKQIQDLNVDMIVLTGDLIDRKTSDFQDVFHLIDKLVQINPQTYFVTGNHEWDNPRKKEFLSGLKTRGVTILSNKNIELEKNGSTFHIIGIDDVSTERENMEEAFYQVNDQVYNILLSHSPSVIQKYADLPVDLVLSGHTHGGQVRLPLIGAIVAPDEGLFPHLQKGIYNIKDNSFLYIDSGLGTTALPIRFLNQSQISLITIRSNE
ncbi:metallophosphoesterase [Oceanobacillus caeni]|uniref:Calcineurin-like phosphoesterase domain-containing protein n=1 Tax=Oceanobacillus caeni TaxID=405946 RepID=A0ABR5MG22_9BACI|nr:MULTISPECIES: metallophosphoesterase [Bacillaceae]KPH71354.1 hypothetical protein AFL42_15355 [Oceanobacillus caeni]MCR1833762.1 metallophosphoesterase [Oceanobacillus caeni]